MQKASDLSSQRARFYYVTERACCIEKLTLKLRRNCVPLHDEGCPEAAKDVLFDLGHRPNGDRLSIAGVFRMGVVRTDHFVEVIRQPILIRGQVTKALL